MIVKKTFSLLPGKENILNLSGVVINTHAVPHGLAKARSILKMEKKISHAGRDVIIDILDNPKPGKPLFVVVNLPDYILPVTYNEKTQQILINVAYFGTDDISGTTPDPRNLYACFMYGYVFYNLINNKVEINKKIAVTITSFLLSVFVRLFGKDYGLLAAYSHNIPKLKFLLGCYILSSFFGVTDKKELYSQASTIASFDHRSIEEELNKYNFSDIEVFIKCLSELKVMPGITKYIVAKKFLQFFGVNFLPALEDASRFISVLSTATVSGNTIVPTFIATKYNQTDFNSIIRISKAIFTK